jgi:hypothetical protein
VLSSIHTPFVSFHCNTGLDAFPFFSTPLNLISDTFSIVTSPQTNMISTIFFVVAALAALPLSQASNVWTVNCAPLTQERSDPIVSPGKISSHVHAVVGSSAFSRHMTANNAAASGDATTCDKATDHSNYWSPSAYRIRSDGKFDLLPFQGMAAYYTNYTCSYNAVAPGYCTGVRDAIAPPKGLRIVAGDPNRRTFNTTDLRQAAILIEAGTGEVYGIPPVLDGRRIAGHVRFPSCWDGTNLDSEDHFSHTSYPDPALHGDTQGGMCPSTHPVALINIGAEFGFGLDGLTDGTKLVFSNGDTTGAGFHADFFAGWKDEKALTNSFMDCFDNDDCPWRAFNSPTGEDPNPTRLVPEDDVLVEEIGLNGPIDKLPGDNPVYKPSRIMRRREW